MRGHVIDCLRTLRMRLTLPGPQGVTELEVVTKLGGQPFEHPEHLAEAADTLMAYFGVEPSKAATPSNNKTLRAVNKAMPSKGRAAAAHREQDEQRVKA